MRTYDPKRSGNTIYVYGDDLSAINKAIGQLRHKTSALMKELKEKRYHKPNSVKKREALKKAIAKERMRIRKDEMYS